MILIKSGRLLDVRAGTESVKDLLIENGVVARIGESLPDDACEQVIDASGMVVAPGLIDAHAHFRQPGFIYKEDIASGAKAAAKGGFTTVICMANTKPVADNEETFKEVLEHAKKADINVLSVAAVSKDLHGGELTDMAALKSLGAVGFSDDGVAIASASFLRRAMLAVKALQVPISLHEEDLELIGVAGINDGEAAQKLGVTGSPAVSESSMVARDCMLALDTGAPVHMQHISCAQSVEVLRFAKSLGANVTAEVTPHHFSLTQDEIFTNGTLAKVNPPLRMESDRQSLIAGLKDGTVDMIATDHAPHSAEEKSKPLMEAPSGMIGLETALALGITNLVRPGFLTLAELISKMTLAPAKLYGLDSGYIAEGKSADIVIFDENSPWVVESFVSKSNNSPFIGKTLYGEVKYTICRGKMVYRA